MRRARLILVSLCCLAGCQVDQGKEVETYRREIRLSDQIVTHDPASPLNLRQAVLLANQNDEGLKSQGEEYLKALIQQRRTIANFLPTVDLVPVYSRRDKVRGETGSNSQYRSFDVSAESSVNLFNGFQDVNRAWRDDYVARQRLFQLKDAQEQLLIDTASVFYQVLRSEASVRVLESSLQLQDARYRDVKGRFDAGVARALAVSQTEAQIAQTRTTLISARADVVQARSRLQLLTAADVATSVMADDFYPPALPTLEAMLDAARVARSDLRAAEQAAEAARYDVEVAFGQYYPSVSLDFGAYLYRESVPEARSWDAALSANIPIFSAGRIEADVRTAWSNFRQALLARLYAERSMRSQVEQAYSALQASDERLTQLQVQVAAAQQTLNQAEQSYTAGLATNLERITAQDTLLQTQLQLASEQYDRKLFHLALLQRAGLLREAFEQASTTQPATQPTVPISDQR